MRIDLFKRAKTIQEEKDVLINASTAIKLNKSFDINQLPHRTREKILKVLQGEIDELNKEFENL